MVLRSFLVTVVYSDSIFNLLYKTVQKTHKLEACQNQIQNFLPKQEKEK